MTTLRDHVINALPETGPGKTSHEIWEAHRMGALKDTLRFLSIMVQAGLVQAFPGNERGKNRRKRYRSRKASAL